MQRSSETEISSELELMCFISYNILCGRDPSFAALDKLGRSMATEIPYVNPWEVNPPLSALFLVQVREVWFRA